MYFRTHQPVLGGRTGEGGARGLTAPATWPRPPCGEGEEEEVQAAAGSGGLGAGLAWLFPYRTMWP